MTLIIEDDDGTERRLPGEIAYDVLCEDDVEGVEDDLNIKLTYEQRKKVARYCQKAESFPNMEDLRDIVRNVHSGYFD